MKASQAGVNNKYAEHVLNHFGNLYNWGTYIQNKYDGLFPSNMPTKKEFKELNNDIYYHRTQGDPRVVNSLIVKKNRMIKIMKAVQKEWMRQQ